ncbi:MAG: histidinol dehydrogenase [Oscillospiraceae bacterium]|jgi:histidinol dehydrogenase|nr:histidinol dehydrogenase [Oscillospiraceae bacterium]
MMRLYENLREIEDLLAREESKGANVERQVAEILEDVRENGDAALLAYSRRFDCPHLASTEVLPEEIEAACARISPDFMETLRQAKENITAYHEMQLREGFRMEKADGVILGQRVMPIEKIGIYVPGGTASYPSTVLMNAIPAKLAGVKLLVMVTPAGRDGSIRDEILAAASLCGVDRIFKIGGAQAIAALAYGTQSVPKVYKIVGPGNIYVATAKRMVFGRVSIDMIAGPSEILIVADKAANARFLAADLLSQAEHDALASAVLVTDDRALALAVQTEVERQLSVLPRAEIARKSIDVYGKILLVENIDRAIEIANAIAPEHLELCVEEPFSYLDKVKNAGSVFLGAYTPEPLGDYFAGPNHTLPTSGTAKFSSPLSVDDFVKKSAYLYYPRQALEKSGQRVADFARREGLDAHARSITIRMEGAK